VEECKLEQKTVPLAQTVQELVGYPHVLATAYQISLTNNELGSKDLATDKKVFIRTYLNKCRVIGCFDSGSDLTIMHDTLLTQNACNTALYRPSPPSVSPLSRL
jgi:hypothetical protein